MKKIIYSMLMLAISAMTFTSCEDVPAPYGWPFNENNGGGGGEETQEGVYLSESFAKDFGSFTLKTIKGVDWVIDFSTAKATGYSSDGTTPSESYLISPAIDLSKSTGAYLEFEYILRYVRDNAIDKVLITDNYTGDPSSTTWTDISGTLEQANDWNTFYKYSQNLPANFIGKSAVTLALYYSCDNKNSATWEVRNLKLVEGESQGSGGDVGPITPTEGTGTGTAADPYNVAAAINVTNQLAAGAQTDEVYVKGIISEIKEIDTGQYGNATYYISDDGTTTNQYYVFRGKYLNNEKFTSADQIKVGDVVVICGRLLNYQGNTPEFAQGNYIYSINGQGGSGGNNNPPAGTGTGTAADPYNVAAAISVTNQLAAGAQTDDVYVKGTISNIKEIDTGQYGNATYYISDDGTTANQFYVFRGKYLNNEKFTSSDQIKVGDVVVICGKLLNYQGNTPEFAQGNYIYSINGQGGSGGNDNPPAGTAKGDGTEANPFNAIAAIQYATSVGQSESDKDVYITGKVVSIKENYGDSSYGNATFYISEDGTETNQFYVFRCLYFNNEKYTSGDKLKKGDEVVICGKVTCYMGNTPETVGNKNHLVKLNGKTSSGGGGDQGGGGGGGTTTGNVTKTVSGTTVTLVNNDATASNNEVTVDLNQQGWADKSDPATITLSDGTTIEFSIGEGKSAPKYYAATKGVRIYAKNTITIKGTKAIAKVVMTCDSYNGTDYIGNSTLFGSISGTTFTIVNENTEASGGVQLRVQTITITYAN